jgi:hypothetical protein
MGDKEKLVQIIADTLQKQLAIDAPPQRVTQSSSFKKTRSRNPPQIIETRTVLLLDGNTWKVISEINDTTARTTYKGNIKFFKGILENSKAKQTKKIYTIPRTGTFFGNTILPDSNIQDSILLTDYVFKPLGIKIEVVQDTELDKIDSVFWLSLLEEKYIAGEQPFFPDAAVNLLIDKAKRFGMILQGEWLFWNLWDTYYFQTFYKNTKWTFVVNLFFRDWVSQNKNSKNALVVAGSSHGIPVSELREKNHAIATFDVGGVTYAGAIAWRMT